MFSLYLVLKFIHIAAAITAVGANITYGVWNARSQSEPAHLGFTLKGIKFIDDRIANPAYGVLLLTGALMLIVGRLSIKLWIVLALVLFAVLVGVAVALYSPLLRKLIALVDAGDTTSPEFSSLINRNRMLGGVFALIVVLILVLMVFQPTL
jgi:uncharacterized membrane protein